MWPFFICQVQKVRQVYQVDLVVQVWMAQKEIEEILVLEACLALKVNPDVGLLICTMSTETVPDRLLMLDSTWLNTNYFDSDLFLYIKLGTILAWLHSCNLRVIVDKASQDEAKICASISVLHSHFEYYVSSSHKNANHALHQGFIISRQWFFLLQVFFFWSCMIWILSL